jgi:hypothetical protein
MYIMLLVTIIVMTTPTRAATVIECRYTSYHSDLARWTKTRTWHSLFNSCQFLLFSTHRGLLRRRGVSHRKDLFLINHPHIRGTMMATNSISPPCRDSSGEAQRKTTASHPQTPSSSWLGTEVLNEQLMFLRLLLHRNSQ